jgi:hypothetical protein
VYDRKSARRVRPRAKLEAEILVLRQQINVLRRTAPKEASAQQHRPIDIRRPYRLFPMFAAR